MDRAIKTITTLLIATFLMACNDRPRSIEKELLPSSSGKYGEVLVVIDSIYEAGQSGDAIRKIFNEKMPGLPQEETMFRMSTVSSGSFKSILRRARNILKINIGRGKKKNIVIERDVWAKNQLLIQITASNGNDAARILSKNKQTLRDYFNEEELNRLGKQYAIDPQKDLVKKLKESYQVSLVVPPGFILMENNQEGFWIKKEKRIGEHQIIQGLIVYSEPYLSQSILDNSNMISNRNRFTMSNIQGQRDSSYMKVYEEIAMDTNSFTIDGLYVKSYRGLWNMTNDFMGGPFLHYSLIDTTENRVVHMDGFVFAPKFNKREYLRELEGLMRTIDIN